MSSRKGLLARHAARAMVAAILVIALPSPASAGNDPTVVTTDAGRVRGIVTGGYRLFQGIPSPPRRSGHGASRRPNRRPTGRR